ncbi:hypothetical protein X975_14623, partial [Stegodyphus mimosarum]
MIFRKTRFLASSNNESSYYRFVTNHVIYERWIVTAGKGEAASC